MKTAAAILVLAALACVSPTAARQAAASAARFAPSVADWRHDLDAIVADVRLLHPDPFARTSRVDFLREVDALKAAIPALGEEQRVVRAMRLIASLGDGHTQLEPDQPAFAWWYPVRLYEFTDGVFVTSAHRSVAELAGAQVVEIAGRPAAEAVAAARRLMGADNASGSRERLYAIHSAGLMKGLGVARADGRLPTKLRLKSGRTVERVLSPSRTDRPGHPPDDASFEWQFRSEMYGLPFDADSHWVSAFRGLPASAFAASDTTRPAHLVDRAAYGARPLPARDAYYVRTNHLSDSDFVPFFQRVLAEVDRQRPRRLILDWRYNFGGDGSKVAFMIQEFIARKADPPWRELYLLTGRRTFSAAIMALDAFIDNLPHTIVGEPAGGPLNHFGDPTSRRYPRTGLRLHVSTLWHQLSASNDLSDLIPVDVPAPFSFADYAAGRDPAVDPILAGEEMRSIPVIAAAEGGAAARRVYLERKARFGRIEWWRPPRDLDLRFVGQEQRGQKKFAAAIETSRLNAEIHPWVWNVWLNLGLALRAAGQKTEGLRCYRCVMAVDPNNFNGDAIRDLFKKEDPADTTTVIAGCPAR